jgi:hypothetical protein
MACNSPATSRESSQRRDVESIPIESVDVETNGKRFGDTHFTLNSGELFLRYEYFDSNETANSKLLKKKETAGELLKIESVFDKNGQKIGEKILAVFLSEDKKKQFCLFWTKGNKLTEIKTESIEAVKEFEQTYRI